MAYGHRRRAQKVIFTRIFPSLAATKGLGMLPNSDPNEGQIELVVSPRF